MRAQTIKIVPSAARSAKLRTSPSSTGIRARSSGAPLAGDPCGVGVPSPSGRSRRYHTRCTSKASSALSREISTILCRTA